MDDLSSLLKIAPTTAAGFMGINQARSEQMDDLKQQELADLIRQRAAEESRKAAMNPYALEKAQLDNAGLRAGLPGIVADSSLKGTNAAKAAGTLDSDIEAGQVDNKMKIYQKLGSHLGSMSDSITNNPNVPPHLALQQSLQASGIPQGAQQALMNKYANVPPSQLAAKLKADGEKILRENSAYVQAIDQEGIQQAGANARNAATIKGQKDIEQMRIDAGKYNRNQTKVNVETRLLTARSAAEKAEILEQAYNIAQAAGDADTAQQYAVRAQQARQRAAEDAANRGAAQPRLDIPGVTNQGTIQNLPGPQANAPIAGNQPAAPTAPPVAKPQSIADLSKMYPGVPPEKLREAYKRKFGVDLK